MMIWIALEMIGRCLDEVLMVLSWFEQV